MRFGYLSATAVLVLVVGIAPLGYGQSKVGFVNLKRIVSESPAGQAAQRELKKLQEAKQAELAREEARIKARQDALAESAGTLSASEREDEQERLRKAVKEYQRTVADAQEALKAENRKLVNAVLEEADKALREIAGRQRYAMILKDPSVLGYMDPAVDITAQVLEFMSQNAP